MKKVITLAVLVLFLFLFSFCKKESTPSETLPPEPKSACLSLSLENGLIAFYPFSSGSLNDFSGNNHHLSNTSTAKAVTDRSGNNNCAFEFHNDSTNEFLINTQTSFLNELNSFSISLWYQPLDTSRTSAVYETLISRDSVGSCPNRRGQWSIGLYDCRRAVFARLNDVWDSISPGFTTCEQEIISRTGKWHHTVATYNHVTDEMKIYRNSILQETATGVAGCNTVPTIQDIGALIIGKEYTGKIDDILIYNRTLSIDEVNQLNDLAACCSE